MNATSNEIIKSLSHAILPYPSMPFPSISWFRSRASVRAIAASPLPRCVRWRCWSNWEAAMRSTPTTRSCAMPMQSLGWGRVGAGHEDDMGVHNGYTMGTPWYIQQSMRIFTHAHARFTSVGPWDDHRISSNQVGLDPGMEDSEGITSRLHERSRATQATADWLLQCQNLDGGFGCRPRECESHVPWAHMPRHQESPGRNQWELLSII